MSLEIRGLTIIFDLEKTESDAKFTLDRRWKTEDERMALTNAANARELLKLLTDENDELGCMKLKALDHSDAIYFVGNALENGQVSIYKPSYKAFLKELRVWYRGSREGPTRGRGDIYFQVPGEFNPFFGMLWWVA